jgi:uncharacterized membrane protein YcaP (DUF421 family)
MWNDLMDLGVSVPDKIVRTLAVYVALIVLLRLAGVLVGMNSFNVHVLRPRRGVASLLEGTTTVLAWAGEWLPDALRREGVRTSDLEGALRRQNAYKIADVAALKLEPGGTVVVDLKPELENATKEDVARLEAKLDRLLG